MGAWWLAIGASKNRHILAGNLQIPSSCTVGGGSARGEVGRMEISDGEQRSTCGDGEWWCGVQSPVTPT